MTVTTNDQGQWLRRFRPACAAPRLVCLPHAGGAATAFTALARALGDAADVCGVQYPGRQDRRREPALTDLHDLADRVAAELRGSGPGPVALFGHSMGASLGYEVGRRLEAEGGSLLGLFASGRRAPSTTREDAVHTRDDAGVVAALQELSGTSSELLTDPELLEMILPAVRADYTAVETYRPAPGPELRCPVVAVVGTADPVTTLDEARAWERHTGGGFELEVLPGGHFYLSQTPENTTALAALVAKYLAVWSR